MEPCFFWGGGRGQRGLASEEAGLSLLSLAVLGGGGQHGLAFWCVQDDDLFDMDTVA